MQQIEEIFHAACELPATERETYLSKVCGNDEELRREVELLLASDGEAGSLIESPAYERIAGMLAGDRTQINPGMKIGHYEILSRLGAGGMGEVWRARDTQLKRDVAIKMLPPEFSQNADRLRRFEREARAASALNHPNIITVHEIGEAETGRFIVMELVQGHTLRRLEKPCPLEQLFDIGGQIAKALTAAHAAGITHRDIKPDNIMFRDDGYVKMLDFGLARLIPATATGSEADAMAQHTSTGALLGTVAYMSPEQARGETAGPASDIFAFGIILFELATGKHPFKAESQVGYLNAITLQTPPPLTSLKPGIPATLNSLILRMLEKNPGQRPTASEVAHTLSEMDRHGDATTLHEGEAVAVSRRRHTVGRERELNELRLAFNSTKTGRGMLLCVTGEPGIGKTTLVEDFLAELTAENQCTVARGRCSERLAGTEAYLPLLEALESLLHTSFALTGMMKHIAPTWYAQIVPLSGDSEESARLQAEVKAASQERMKRELTSFLQAVAPQQPLVLFFDDLHWADVSTIDLLNFLAGKFDVQHVLVIVTYRPSDMLLAKHPFLQIKPDLRARGLCRELLLEFLSEEAIGEYLKLEFPNNSFPAELPRLIQAKTEGSPLFMADLVRNLYDRSVIVEEEGRWQLAQSVEDIRLDLPDSVKGMIEHKIQQLGEIEHQLLVAASVQGFQFDSAVISKVLKADEEDVEGQLQALEADHHFIQLVEEGEFPDHTLTLRYRFVHVLYQNELYASLTATKRARLSRAAAEALEGHYGARSGEVASELASLYETARDFSKAVDYLGRAAEQAAGVFAFQEAITLAGRGVELLASMPESVERDQQELWLQSTLAHSWSAIRGFGYPDVGSSYMRAYELAKKLGLNTQNAFAFFTLVAYFFVTGQLRNSLELAQEILQLAKPNDNKQLLAAAYCSMGIVEQFFGNFTSASVHFKDVIDVLEDDRSFSLGNSFDPIVYALGLGAWNTWILGYPDQAVHQSTEAKVRAEETRNPFHLAHYFGFAGFLYQCRGDVEKVLELSESKIGISEENAYHQNRVWGSMQMGWAIARKGDREKGLAMMLKGVTKWRAVGTVAIIPYWHNLIAEIYGYLNKPEEGLTLLSESLDIVNTTDHRSYEPELHRIKGELLLLQGAGASEVEGCYEKALEVARLQLAKSYELRVAISLARLWQEQNKQAEARQLLSEIYGWFTEGFDTADLKEAKMLLGELES